MVAMPLGLGLVAAAVRRAGHDVRSIDLLGAASPCEAVRASVAEHRPDAIGISIRNIDDQNRAAPRFLLEPVREVVRACRAATSAPVVVGGAGYSIFPTAALAFLGASYGVRGDGEVIFPKLLDHLARGADPACLPGVEAPGRRAAAPAWDEALDALPAWDDTLTALAPADDPTLWVPVQTRRGCPNDCVYCSTALVQGRTIRCRSPRLVVDSLAELARRGRRRFFFVDNSFNLPEAHAVELCHRMRDAQLGVAFRCIVYPERLSETLASAMAEAGCVEASIGFESGSPGVLRALHKRFSPDDVRAVCDRLARHGVRRFGFLLFGAPGETRETVEESLAFAESLGLDGLRITVGIRIYPGTPLAAHALAEGVIASNDDLLEPRFYLAPGLEPWIHERSSTLAATGRAR